MTWCHKAKPTPRQATGGAAAHREAQANLAAARARWAEVHRVATSLRQLRTENHFAKRIELLFQGKD